MGAKGLIIDAVAGRCDRGATWRTGAGVSGDAGLLRPAQTPRADCSTQRGAVQPTAAAARHRLHRRPRAGPALVRILAQVVSMATTTPPTSASELVATSQYEYTQQRPTVAVDVVVA